MGLSTRSRAPDVEISRMAQSIAARRPRKPIVPPLRTRWRRSRLLSVAFRASIAARSRVARGDPGARITALFACVGLAPSQQEMRVGDDDTTRANVAVGGRPAPVRTGAFAARADIHQFRGLAEPCGPNPSRQLAFLDRLLAARHIKLGVPVDCVSREEERLDRDTSHFRLRLGIPASAR